MRLVWPPAGRQNEPAMTWWCSASGVTWEWVWKPYPGVWIALLLLIVPYLRRMRGPREAPSYTVAGRWAPVSFMAGVVALWAATDWPIGALGAGYLLEGTVRWDRLPDGTKQVRVSPELIKVSDGTNLWAVKGPGSSASVHLFPKGADR